MANVHLGMVSANEFYELETTSGLMIRRIRSPKSLKPHLTILADELYRGYTKGFKTTDYSYAIGEPGRIFRAKVILLFWTGDYPALALVSGTQSKTCHWCHYKSSHGAEVNRRCWGDYRCYLPPDHPARKDGTYGPVENRPAPAPRTHQDYVKDALESEAYEGAQIRHPTKISGVKELSPLGALPMFDLAWDVLGDMMHIIYGIWSRHVFEMLAGRRAPAKPKPRKKWTPEQNAALFVDHAMVLAKLKAWALPKPMVSVCTHTHSSFIVHNVCIMNDVLILMRIHIHRPWTNALSILAANLVGFATTLKSSNTRLFLPHTTGFSSARPLAITCCITSSRTTHSTWNVFKISRRPVTSVSQQLRPTILKTVKSSTKSRKL